MRNAKSEATEVAFADDGWETATDEEKLGFWTQWAYQWTVMDARIMKDGALICQLQVRWRNLGLISARNRSEARFRPGLRRTWAARRSHLTRTSRW